MKSLPILNLPRAAVAASLFSALALPVFAQSPAPSPQLKLDQSQLPRSTGAITSFAPVVDKIAPSVVTIFATRDVKANPNSIGGNPMLRRFFGIPDNSGPDGDDDSNGGGEGGKT